MDQLDKDLMTIELIKYMSYQDIIRLCQTNNNYYLLCQNDIVWHYLLKRDFQVDITINAMDMYKKYHYTLNYFSQHFPVITLKALKFIVDYINQNYWKLMIKKQQKQYHKNILTINHIINLLFTYNAKIPTYQQLYPHINELTDMIINHGCEQFLDIITLPNLIYYIGHTDLFPYDLDLAELLIKKLKIRGYDVDECIQIKDELIHQFDLYLI